MKTMDNNYSLSLRLTNLVLSLMIVKENLSIAYRYLIGQNIIVYYFDWICVDRLKIFNGMLHISFGGKTQISLLDSKSVTFRTCLCDEFLFKQEIHFMIYWIFFINIISKLCTFRVYIIRHSCRPIKIHREVQRPKSNRMKKVQEICRLIWQPRN